MAGLVVGLMPKDICCFERISNFGIPCIAERREAALRATWLLSVTGLALAVLGVVGGLSSSGIGRTLAWAKYSGPATDNDDWYAGVKYICNEGTRQCTKFTSLKCHKFGHLDTSACDGCSTVADEAMIPSVICAMTYLLYAHNTWKRVHNQDSNQAKIMSMFACFFAGFNFLGVLSDYYMTCIKQPEVDAQMGLGLLLMGLGGSGLKFICGFLHFSLPVEHTGSSELHDSEYSSEAADSDTEDQE